MPDMEMATIFSASSSLHHHKFSTCSKSKCFNSDPLQPLIVCPKFHVHRPSLPVRICSHSNTRLPHCLSAGPDPPSPPDSDPPQPPGLTGKLSSFQDRVQIFFAVLFWMSLFFWASAGDGRNSDRPNKGSRFRR